MAAGDIISNLRGIIGSILRIGLEGASSIQWKNSSGVVEARNDDDSAYIIGRGADPVGANDWLTLGYYNANPQQGSVSIIQFAVGLVTATSATSIPAGAQVLKTRLDITTAYDGGVTISVGNTADPDAFLLTTENAPAAENVYTKEQDTDSGAADNVDVVITGVATVGAATCTVWYAEPDA